MKMLFWLFCCLILIFFLSNLSCQGTEINIDVVDNAPYIDFTLKFDSNFTTTLPDFESIIYIKVLPKDINYVLNSSKVVVNANEKGILILKYKGTEFLEGAKTLEKTFNFDLLPPTTITLNADKKIFELNPEYTVDENSYVWQTNEKNFLVHIALEKEGVDFKYWIIILICIIIVLVLILPKIIKNYKREEKQNLYLDSTQKNILDFVKKKKSITQQEIANSLQIKKSNMSKILNKMERNSLIERKKVGKVNKVVLAEKKEN
ncbi:MAG: hypothetical protein COT14_00355 [Candidatus Diapherotrites archaeon CG08_land_8_20_14_0_20_30_16]|nr:MAG: hypothetical protein COT14_00355 [Candidatus Diapherotrites archaeon CG08_land_8_20_14_0_20_30_16]